MPRKPKFTEEDEALVSSLLEESDRGCVLVAHGRLDVLLGKLLRDYFEKHSEKAEKEINWLFEGHQPLLGSFRSRLVVARALGLVDADFFNSATQLTALRNHFGHHPGRVKLTSDRVATVADCIGDRNMSQFAALMREVGRINKWKEVHSPERRRFVGVALTLAIALEREISWLARKDLPRLPPGQIF